MESEEIVENVSETVEDTNSEQSENVENSEVETEVKKEEYKPWKKIPETIPYNRFSEKVQEVNEYKKKLEEFQKQLDSYRNTEEKVKTIESIEDLDINDFQDLKDYNRAFAQVFRKELQKEQEIIEERTKVERIEKEIFTTFQDKITKAVSRNPEVNDALNYVNQFAERIPAETRYALLTDENAADIIYEIATTEGLLEALTKMNPLDAARKLGKISSKYDSNNTSESSIPKSMEKVQEKIPSKMGTPNLKGKPVSGQIKYRDDMSMAEYKQWARANNIKI